MTAPLGGLEPLKSGGLVEFRLHSRCKPEAIGGCEQRSDLFAFCKIAPAVVRRVDLRGQEGKGGNTVRQGLGWKMWAWRL